MYFLDTLVANNKSADQTARMRRLVCTFIVRTLQRQGFSRRGPCIIVRERSGSVVECLTRVRGAEGSRISGSLRCVIEQDT